MLIVKRTAEKVDGYRTSDGTVHTSAADAEHAQADLDMKDNMLELMARMLDMDDDDAALVIGFLVACAEELRSILGPCECQEMRGRKYEKKLYNWDGKGDSPWPGEKITETKSSTSPPATWTEVTIVTRVDDGGGVWGVTHVPEMREYTGEDMR